MTIAPGRSPRTALLAALIALLAGLIHPVAAGGDADPASDTLLVQNVFYPYSPPTPAASRQALSTALSELAGHGTKLRVAIIHSPVDLGGIPGLFGQVHRYTAFLETEISFKGPQPLLVVMPQGVASSHAGPASAVSSIAVDTHDGSAGLVSTALTAVQRIAAAEGHPIAAVTPSSGSGSGVPIAVIIPVALVIVIAGGFGARLVVRRRRAAPLQTS